MIVLACMQGRIDLDEYGDQQRELQVLQIRGGASHYAGFYDVKTNELIIEEDLTTLFSGIWEYILRHYALLHSVFINMGLL